MRKKVIFVYLVLITLALPVPLLHHYRTNKAIETRRPVMQLNDGTYSPMLMPGHILILRWLGELSQVTPFVLLVALLLCFRFEVLTRPSILCAFAISECAFTTIYASYATFLLGIQWLGGL